MKTQSINFLSAVLVAMSVMLLSGNMAAAADLFASNGVTRCVYKFTPDGTQSTFLSNRDFPTGLAFDSNGNLYEAEPGKIYKFTPDGTQSTFGTVSLFEFKTWLVTPVVTSMHWHPMISWRTRE